MFLKCAEILMTAPGGGGRTAPHPHELVMKLLMWERETRCGLGTQRILFSHKKLWSPDAGEARMNQENTLLCDSHRQ